MILDTIPFTKDNNSAAKRAGQDQTARMFNMVLLFSLLLRTKSLTKKHMNKCMAEI